MPSNNIPIEAISLSESHETILLPVPALKMLLEEIGKQREEIDLLKKDLKLDRADIRDLFEAIDHIEQVKIQPEQKNRGEILRALIMANGGKMFAKDARRKMGLGKATFSVLLRSMNGEIAKRPYHLNKSQLVLSLKSVEKEFS